MIEQTPKIVVFQINKSPRYGLIVDDERIIDLGPAGDFNADWPNAADAARQSQYLSLDAINILPPILGNGRIFAVGRNYADHAAEMKGTPPKWPNFFMRTRQSLVGHGQPIKKPNDSECLDYEGELAVVISRGGRHIAVANAAEHILGFSCFMDGTVRDIQKHSLVAGKNFDQSGAFGPWITPASNPEHSYDIVTELNGDTVQRGNSAEMIFSVTQIIHILSGVTELLPGDVIATGTPAGVGHSRIPPRYLNAGDEITVRIAGIGQLDITVADDHR